MANTTANYAHFSDVPIIGIAQLATANTNRDGTGTVADVVTGAAAGTRLERVTIQGVGPVTAGMVRLYISDGANTRLWREVPVTTTTPSGTVAGFQYVLSQLTLVLPSGYKLRASTNNAETFNVFAEGGNF